MAVDGWWRTGPSLIYSGTGTAGALELLGFCRDGADIDVQKAYREIIADILGPDVPQDFQDFGEVASISCPLVAVDRAVLLKVCNRGNRGANGQLNTPGRIVGANGDDFRLGIAAADDTPWSFSHAIVRPNFNFRAALTVNPFTIRFFSWPYLAYTATSGLNTPLYTRSLA